jgi:NADH:ubiquinone oxidoreductase subunit 5 (subunit L)/multisubunit Na+/H+ antiporter MnhA subunit
MNCLFTLVMLVPLLPLLAAAGIGIYVLRGAAGDAAEPPTARLAEGAAWAALLLMLGLDVLALVEGAPGHFVVGTWFASGDIAVPFSFSLDAAALGIGTLVAALGAVTLRFSRHYLHREAGFHRFFLLMSLFLAGMLLIVLAGNAVLVFVGWELCGVTSWLLIGYAYERPTATGNAQFAFVANRIGDAGFLLGIAIAFLWAGGVEWTELAAWTRTSDFDKVTARLLLFGFLLAAVAKSAQLPFSPWIARALEGPTPSSAIFYGAVMVHAGVWLAIRLEPVLVHVPDIMAYLALIGLLTAVYGALAGLVQTDVKSALLFGTTTQVGLMFLACGLGWFELATWHLALHASWRAWQFLAAPSYMQVAGKAPPAPRWLAGRQRFYNAALQRFWLDSLAQALLVRPVARIGADVRDFDERVLSHLVGMPPQATDRQEDKAEGDDVIRAHGLAGRLLLWIADHLQRFETHLILRGGGGAMSGVLREAGRAFREIERLLEQPRYLLLAVAATFVVIL